jgi:hypothetical protein
MWETRLYFLQHTIVLDQFTETLGHRRGQDWWHCIRNLLLLKTDGSLEAKMIGERLEPCCLSNRYVSILRRMYEHILTEITNHFCGHIGPKAIVKSCMATRWIVIVVHQSPWNLLPVLALPNMLIPFEYYLSASRYKVPLNQSCI